MSDNPEDDYEDRVKNPLPPEPPPIHEPQAPAHIDAADCPACPPRKQEPASEGELERLIELITLGRQAPSSECRALRDAINKQIAAERTDAARQERRRTLEEVKQRWGYVDSIGRWLNERIREAGGE